MIEAVRADRQCCVLVHMGFANLHQLRGHSEKALDHLHRAWEIKEEECHAEGGPDGENEELAEIYTELGKLYCKTEQDNEGLDMYRRALRIYTARCGLASPLTSKAAIKVATVESKLGLYDEAVETFRAAAESMEQQHGDCHKKTVDVWRKLCLLLVKLKDFPGAVSLLDKIITAEKVLFGVQSINLIESYKLLAMVHKVDGKIEEMIETQELVLGIYRQRHGPKDNRTRDLAKQILQIRRDHESESRLSAAKSSSLRSPVGDYSYPGHGREGGPLSPAQRIKADREVRGDEDKSTYDDEEEEEGETDEEEAEEEVLLRVESFLRANKDVAEAAFADADADGSGTVEARPFLKGLMTLAKEKGLLIEPTHMGMILKHVANPDKTVSYRRLPETLQAKRHELEADEQEEDRSESEGTTPDAGPGEQAQTESPGIEAKKAIANSALALELEEMKKKAIAEARAAALAP